VRQCAIDTPPGAGRLLAGGPYPGRLLFAKLYAAIRNNGNNFEWTARLGCPLAIRACDLYGVADSANGQAQAEGRNRKHNSLVRSAQVVLEDELHTNTSVYRIQQRMSENNVE
jgi:hypothetical protein